MEAYSVHVCIYIDTLSLCFLHDDIQGSVLSVRGESVTRSVFGSTEFLGRILNCTLVNVSCSQLTAALSRHIWMSIFGLIFMEWEVCWMGVHLLLGISSPLCSSFCALKKAELTVSYAFLPASFFRRPVFFVSLDLMRVRTTYAHDEMI